MKIQLKRSNVLDNGSAKKPTEQQLEFGELAVNYNPTDPTLFIKVDSGGDGTVIPIVGSSSAVNSLDTLSDVNLGTTTTGDVLQYNGSDWVSDTVEVSELGDVTLTSLSNNQVLSWNGSAWVNVTLASGVDSLDDLSDVTITSAANDDVLSWNGSAWVNTTPQAGVWNRDSTNGYVTTTTTTDKVGIKTGSSTPVADLDLNGNYAAKTTALSGSTIDCSLGNYFTYTVNSSQSISFSNIPSGKAYSLTLEVQYSSGTITWPSSVKWPGDEAPELETGKTNLFMFVTDDGGSRWRAAALLNYTN